MPWTSSCSAAVTTSSTERLCPRWITSAPLAWRMRRMMLMAASWPSKSDAAVTKRILFFVLYSVCREALRSVMAAQGVRIWLEKREATLRLRKRQVGTGQARSVYPGFSIHTRERLSFSREGLEQQECARPDQPDIVVFAHQSFARRSRSALVTTDTELIAMAAPAKIGDSSNPKKV